MSLLPERSDAMHRKWWAVLAAAALTLTAGAALGQGVDLDSAPPAAAGPAAPAGGAPATEDGAVGTASTGSPATSGFGESWGTLWEWFREHLVPFLVSVGALYLLSCLLSWILGGLRWTRTLAAPRYGTMIAFLLWVFTGVVLWGLFGWPYAFLPTYLVLGTLHWGLWLLLGAFALGVVGLLINSAQKAQA